jgi:hypothetical protein
VTVQALDRAGKAIVSAQRAVSGLRVGKGGVGRGSGVGG